MRGYAISRIFGRVVMRSHNVQPSFFVNLAEHGATLRSGHRVDQAELDFTSSIKPEVHHIAVGHHILFAFKAELAGKF